MAKQVTEVIPSADATRYDRALDPSCGVFILVEQTMVQPRRFNADRNRVILLVQFSIATGRLILFLFPFRSLQFLFASSSSSSHSLIDRNWLPSHRSTIHHSWLSCHAIKQRRIIPFFEEFCIMLMPSMHESYPNRIERFHWMKNPLETCSIWFFHFIGQFLERHLGRLIFFARSIWILSRRQKNIILLLKTSIPHKKHQCEVVNSHHQSECTY